LKDNEELKIDFGKTGKRREIRKKETNRSKFEYEKRISLENTEKKIRLRITRRRN
jgi:hypothetical protein